METPSMFSKFGCWMFGHKWETYQTYGVSVSTLGHGVIHRKKCSRCGSEQYSFEGFASIGDRRTSERPSPLKPSHSRDLLSLDELPLEYRGEVVETDDQHDSEEIKSKKSKENCITCRRKKVQDSSECDTSEVQRVQ